MKSNLLYIAMFLMTLCMPFSGNKNEVRWLWENHLEIPLVLTIASLMCIGFYLYKKEKTNKANHV